MARAAIDAGALHLYEIPQTVTYGLPATIGDASTFLSPSGWERRLVVAIQPFVFVFDGFVPIVTLTFTPDGRVHRHR
jgi:hypothetical protein